MAAAGTVPYLMDFDARAVALNVEIRPDWEPQVREQWLANQAGRAPE
jgi:hypothetical protein